MELTKQNPDAVQKIIIGTVQPTPVKQCGSKKVLFNVPNMMIIITAPNAITLKISLKPAKTPSFVVQEDITITEISKVVRTISITCLTQ